MKLNFKQETKDKNRKFLRNRSHPEQLSPIFIQKRGHFG